MNHESLKRYIDAQVEEIQKYKWLESEKAHKDIGGDKAAEEWISKYAKDFHNYYFEVFTNNKDKKKGD
jgi:hypothetical protein